MDENIRKVESPYDRHPWGGTVIHSEITEPVYPEVVTSRIGDLYMDMGNAVAANGLDIVAQRVRESTQKIQNTEFRLLLTGNDQLIFDYYLANTLSLSHFEATMFLILTEHLAYERSSVGEEIVHHFEKEREHFKIVREEEEGEKRKAIVDLIGQDYTASRYIRLIEDCIEATEELDVPDGLFECFDEMRSVRGSVVHNLTSLIQSGDQDTVKSQMDECANMVAKSSDWLHQELTIHQGIIQSLGPDS